MLQRRVAKARRSAVRAARTSKAAAFDRFVGRTERRLAAAQTLVPLPPPDQFDACEHALALALEDVRACIDLVPRPD
jgi:hypothetical protein